MGNLEAIENANILFIRIYLTEEYSSIFCKRDFEFILEILKVVGAHA